MTPDKCDGCPYWRKERDSWEEYWGAIVRMPGGRYCVYEGERDCVREEDEDE